MSNDEEYRTNLLENATRVLDSACSDPNIQLVAELPAKDMNLIAAIWYAESCAIVESGMENDERLKWVNDVRRKFPSCFCDSDQFL